MAKTYKREMSGFIISITMCFGVWSVWEEQAWRVFELLTLPSFALVAGAFGLDWKGKQNGT